MEYIDNLRLEKQLKSSTEEKHDRIFGFLIGIAIGGLLVYILLSRKKQSEMQYQSNLAQSNSGNLYNNSNQTAIQDNYLNNKIESLEMKLSQLVERQNYPIQQNPIQQNPIQQNPIQQNIEKDLSYKNNEEWEILRDDSGDIKKLRVIRDSKVKNVR